jgi:D-beta-D-heptose 7-phosphate kinase/D-beta-D-heptose 1-phosphate adenosyltransferase
LTNRDPLSLIERYPSVRILCVGDVMLDRFVYGDVSRISPEAPIPVIAVREERSMLGGAGNVARNISSLGARLDFLTVAGCDAAGEEICRALEALENATAHVVRDASRRSSVKIRYIAQQQQMLRVDSECSAPLNDDLFPEVARRFHDALPSADAVLLSDYAKGVLSGRRAGALIEAAVAAGKPVFVDPKGSDFSRYRRATLLKPNLSELRDAARMPVDTPEQVESAARALLSETGAGAILVTLGAAGMMLVRPGLPVFEIHGRAKEVFDVSGAGDTAAANLAVAAAAGAPLEQAVSLANIAAGIVVSKLGTATVTREQLARHLQSGDRDAPEAEIQDYNSAVALIQNWRRAGLRVGAVTANPAMPQPLLLESLRTERSGCDKLVVLVIGDGSGVARPNATGDFCAFVSALVWVDLVVPCSAAQATGFTAHV